MVTVLTNSFLLLLMLALPALVFGVTAHFLELGIQKRLAMRFGWKSVMWTGWLGTPIHELSHAVFCWVFGHRIDDLRLFSPDFKTGRLGYVRHSFRSGDWYQELGNVFIGTAPFLGGSLAMLLFLFLFFPTLATNLLSHEALANVETWSGLVEGFLAAFFDFLKALFHPKNLGSLRLWVFLYLTLCVASHMAPSQSDYVGAARGVFLAVGLAILIAIVLTLFSSGPLSMVMSIFRLATPLIVLGGLALFLCSVSWLAVVLLTSMIPVRRF